MTFHYWLEQKFLEWMTRERQRKTVTAFADYIGVTQSMMTRYLNGQMIPTGDNVHKLAARLGPEVYDLLGLARPDPETQYIIRHWDKLPPEEQKRFREMVEKYADEPYPAPDVPPTLKPKTAR
jgi:transcriptional regulator with XRE-family HTH domain